MNKRLIILLLGLFTGTLLPAQSAMEAVLAQILANNKTLQAEDQRLTAAQTGYRTGISLYNPVLNWDYMIGSPAGAGNQNDIALTQPFDFPTVYGWRNKVADLQVAQTTHEMEILKRKILLDARKTCLELVYLNKRKQELSRRTSTATTFFQNLQKKFDQQEATILDLNKARLKLTNTQAEGAQVQAEIDLKLTELQALNGGMEISFGDTSYPPAPVLQPLEELQGEMAAADPMLRYLESQRQIGNAQVQLSRAQSLPKFEVGYHYQGILGQTYQGAHIGLTLPLWENKNKVQYQQLQTGFYEMQIQEQRHIRNFSTQILYEKYLTHKTNFEAYAAEIKVLMQSDLLDKALQTGQITVLEYYLELSLYQESMDRYLQLEKDYQVALAELLHFRQ